MQSFANMTENIREQALAAEKIAAGDIRRFFAENWFVIRCGFFYNK
jgi:hypothetical protein